MQTRRKSFFVDAYKKEEEDYGYGAVRVLKIIEGPDDVKDGASGSWQVDRDQQTPDVWLGGSSEWWIRPLQHNDELTSETLATTANSAVKKTSIATAALQRMPY
jgi:hypothetical protein